MGRRDARIDESGRWWLNIQISLALAGGAGWLAGLYLEHEYISGVGTGLVIAALILRLARRDGTPWSDDATDA
jgi:hypothetical protein